MRFLSRFGRFGIQLQPMIQEAYATGMARVIQEPIYAFFHVEPISEFERDLVINNWAWNGFKQMEDEVTVVPPDLRIGVFDSEAQGWPDDRREWVEQQLLDYAQRWSHDVVAVPLVTVEPPWPRYDSYRGSQTALLRKLVDEGHSIEQTLAFERQSQKREKLIGALEELLANPDSIGELEEEIVG